MRYSREHKAATRERIIEAAASLFRRHGYNGVGVDAIMAAAGLTRGGFYGHFRSKAELFQSVMRHRHGYTRKLATRSGRDKAALQREGLAIAADYLEPAHRNVVMRGCSLAALVADTVRAGRPAQRACADAVRELAREFARGLEQTGDPDPRALGAIVASIGGLLLASATAADGELADAISAAALDLVEQSLDP